MSATISSVCNTLAPLLSREYSEQLSQSVVPVSDPERGWLHTRSCRACVSVVMIDGRLEVVYAPHTLTQLAVCLVAPLEAHHLKAPTRHGDLCPPLETVIHCSIPAR